MKPKKIYHNHPKSVEDDENLSQPFKHSSGNCSPLKYNLFLNKNQKIKTKNERKPQKKEENMDLLMGLPSPKRFKFIYQIGFGGFGRVWKVYDRSCEKDYAMKEISKKK